MTDAPTTLLDAPGPIRGIDKQRSLKAKNNRLQAHNEIITNFFLPTPQKEFVNRIIEATGCKVVLSSSWRGSPEGHEYIETAIGHKLLDITPRCRSGWFDWSAAGE